jgi:siroheme synthase-like protein
MGWIERARYYMAGLKIADRLCVVIGGGRVAERKVAKLRAAGARVRVVSPSLTAELDAAVKAGWIEHEARGYRSGDLDGAWMAVAATDDETLNRQIAADAEALRCWANVASEGEAGTFIVPAVAEWAGIQVAVTTSGRDPALAKALKEALIRDVQAGRGEFAAMVRAYWQQGARDA